MKIVELNGFICVTCSPQAVKAGYNAAQAKCSAAENRTQAVATVEAIISLEEDMPSVVKQVR